METTAETPVTTPKKICGMGHPMKRKEDPRFIQGQGNYVDDVKLPGMLYMDIVRSPYAHAKILSIDSSEAEAMEGVLAVITGETLKGAGKPPLDADADVRHPDGAAHRQGRLFRPGGLRRHRHGALHRRRRHREGLRRLRASGTRSSIPSRR